MEVVGSLKELASDTPSKELLQVFGIIMCLKMLNIKPIWYIYKTIQSPLSLTTYFRLVLVELCLRSKV